MYFSSYIYVQFFGMTVISLWAMTSTYIVFLLMKVTMGIRLSREEEMNGADWVEHQIEA